MIAIDRLCYHSKLRYINPDVKFALAVFTLILCVAAGSFLISGIVLCSMAFLTVAKGGVSLSRYLKLLSIPLTFLILSTLAIAFDVSRSPLDLWAFSIGDFYLTCGKAGVMDAAKLICVSMGAVSCLYFLSLTTPIIDVLTVLSRLKVPKLLIELMLLIYRFVFLLLDTASSISTAQHARLGNKDYRTSVKSFAALCSALMIRAVKRSGALYDAMEARCYDGSLNFLAENAPPEKKHILMAAAYEAFLLGLVLWRFLS